MVCRTDGLLRHREQRIVRIRLIQQQVKVSGGHRRLMAQPGQVPVQLSHHRHLLPRHFLPAQLRKQVQGQVRIAAQAKRPVRLPGRRHHLENHVDTLGQQVPDRVGIVGADIVALLIGIVEEAACLEEEL